MMSGFPVISTTFGEIFGVGMYVTQHARKTIYTKVAVIHFHPPKKYIY